MITGILLTCQLIINYQFKAYYNRFKAATSSAYTTIANSSEPDKDLLMGYAVKVTQNFYRAFNMITGLLNTSEIDRVAQLNALIIAGTALRTHQIAANFAADRLGNQTNARLLTLLEEDRKNHQLGIVDSGNLPAIKGNLDETDIQDSVAVMTPKNTQLFSKDRSNKLVTYTPQDLQKAAISVSCALLRIME